MDTIKFANGAVHECSLCATIPDRQMAYIALSDVTFVEAAAIFSDPDMTEEMEYADYRLVGYTHLDYVMQESFGIKACLTGGHDERG